LKDVPSRHGVADAIFCLTRGGIDANLLPTQLSLIAAASFDMLMTSFRQGRARRRPGACHRRCSPGTVDRMPEDLRIGLSAGPNGNVA
jgi:hypothetical protein